jgi:hypothetical protein
LAPEPDALELQETPQAYDLDSELSPAFDLTQEPAHYAHPNPEEALAILDAEVESEFNSDFSFELSTAMPWDAPDAPETPEAAFTEISLEDEATEEAQEFELLVEPHEEAAPEISAELSHENEPLHEEASPSMTWTLDWKEEPAKPSKEFGLDEFLAFEASLREDAPAPTSPEPVAFSPEPEAFNQESEAFNQEPEAFNHEPVAFNQEPLTSSPEPVAFSPEPLASSQQPAASSPEVQFELRTAPAVATMTTEIDPDRDSLEDTMRRMAQERRAYLQTYNHHFGQNQARMQQGDLERPAFERQGWDLDASARYSQQNALGDHMVRGEKNDLEFRPNNSFLHDNVD